jgi:hypothetical protein
VVDHGTDRVDGSCRRRGRVFTVLLGAAVVGIVSVAVGGSGGDAAFGSAVALERAPVYQLPPGHVTLASVKTVQGPVVIMLHRIRYLGKVSLCMSEANGSSTSQSCANYPLGPKSDQNIGNNPVWWTTYVGACTQHHFQVISGVLLRAGLTAWLHSPAGLSQMPAATVPKVFGVAGRLVYALIASSPDTVTLRDANGKTVYSAPVEPLTGVPTAQCGASGGSSSTSSTAITIVPGGHTIP